MVLYCIKDKIISDKSEEIEVLNVKLDNDVQNYLDVEEKEWI